MTPMIIGKSCPRAGSHWPRCHTQGADFIIQRTWMCPAVVMSWDNVERFTEKWRDP